MIHQNEVNNTDKSDLLIEIYEIPGNLADTRSKPVLEKLSQHEDEAVSEMATGRSNAYGIRGNWYFDTSAMM